MISYEKLGLKAGLEIHQQLATARKLFCSCSTGFSETPTGREVRRRLRPVAGETGEVDPAASHESFQGKEFVYLTYSMESCLKETDSEPPGPLNPEALEIALEVALLLNCEIPEEIHVMRKTVIDGSNPSGFQRTAIVGLDGWVQTSFGRAGIPTVAVEEESAQILKREEGRTVFGLNRLGIPLVEISTSPDIRSPEQARELAEKLGMVLRSSRVKRGLGTIRQDVNVSIARGSRVEIKGVQDLKGIPRLLEREAERQQGLLEKGQQVPGEVRKANPDGSTTFLRPLPGAARLYPETDSLPIRIEASFVEKIRSNLPELLAEKRQRLEKELGVSQEVIASLEKAKKLELFKQLARLKNVNPAFAATILLSYPTEVQRRQKGDPSRVGERDIILVFEKLDQGVIPKESVLDILADLASGKGLHPEKYRLEKVNIEKEVADLLKSQPGLSFGAYMGILMGKFRGKVPGEEISQALKKKLG